MSLKRLQTGAIACCTTTLFKENFLLTSVFRNYRLSVHFPPASSKVGCSRWGLNKSDQHQFSPNNIHTSLREKVRRIHKMISEGEMLWSIKVGAKQEWPTSIIHISSREKVRRILAHFPRFCWQYFSLSNVFSIHLARKTYFLLCSGLWNIFLNLLLLFCVQN